MELIKELSQFINKATSPFHTVIEVKKMLLDAGFIELDVNDNWAFDYGKKYFVSPYPSCLFAFTIPKTIDFNQGFKIISAHTDQPCFRIKPSPELTAEGYLKLNTEPYGGPILNTWLDRPLSIAGKVVLKSNAVMEPIEKYIDIKKPILIIPNMAIHMNREVNKGIELNRQIDLIPLAALIDDKLNAKDYFINYLGKTCDMDPKDILDFDLYVYNCDESKVIGMHDEFISAPRLDDLAMVHSATQAMIHAQPKQDINVMALLDHEEIGSKSKQGADSALFSIILERIAQGIQYDKMKFYKALTKSFNISADMAHAVHPNKSEKHDPTNRPTIGNGVVIKISGNQKYVTDSKSIGIFQQLCEAAKVPYQKFVNRSDERGGQTLGPITSSYVPIPTVDIGPPMLSMHSSRELMGVKDYIDCVKVFQKYYEIN
ncbi:aspartyl aminopeptidase [Natranaerovirga hydrolytica]|uniref:M18 family aminopeptidase n=1 Tax=Natranaerovirga hydrolytica TaxID=680378 RepID=A0A4R1MDT0_9FIRM|nr:M18 family aminopeptidase [Natranaerovirga hydrolytica]TCK90626.1 aspartyl aminopeptidase [Natranaerovirga hydrolytica]